MDKAGCQLAVERYYQQKEKKEKSQMKRERKIGGKKEIKKVKGIMDISPSYSHYMARRSCFVKRFPKRIQLPHRIRSTSTATAGALPNAPFVSTSHLICVCVAGLLVLSAIPARLDLRRKQNKPPGGR
jgi:hypothetical protein